MRVNASMCIFVCGGGGENFRGFGSWNAACERWWYIVECYIDWIYSSDAGGACCVFIVLRGRDDG